MNPFEIEQKYRLKNPAALRSKIKKLGAKLLRQGFEKNELWDYQNQVRSKGAVLRLRETKKGGLLTFKGPKLKSQFKRRVEVETSVKPHAVRKLFQKMGFRVIARYQKTREEYQLEKSHITIDYLRGHGWFSEIEASPKEIHRLERALGFTKKDREERTYLELVYGPKSVWKGK